MSNLQGKKAVVTIDLNCGRGCFQTTMNDPLRIVFLDAATLERKGDVSFKQFSAR